MTRRDAIHQLKEDPLVAITGRADEVRRYEAAMRTVANPRQPAADLSGVLDAMERIVDEQRNRLEEAIRAYGLAQPDLHARVVRTMELLGRLKGRVQGLRLACRHRMETRAAEQLQEVIEAIRRQIAYAMEVQFG